jgi:hypothetical protein
MDVAAAIEVLNPWYHSVARRDKTPNSGPESLGKGEMRQQALARVMTWDKSQLSHQLTRMQ